METSSTPNITWSESVREFLLHLQAGKAVKTVRFYDVQLRQLTRWADENSAPFDKFGKRHLDRYLAQRSKTVSRTTLRHDAVAAKAFFKWCARNDLLTRSLLADYEVRKAPKPARYMPTHDEIQQLLAALDEFWTPAKNPGIHFMPPNKRLFHRERNRCIIVECRVQPEPSDLFDPE